MTAERTQELCEELYEALVKEHRRWNEWHQGDAPWRPRKGCPTCGLLTSYVLASRQSKERSSAGMTGKAAS